MDFEASSVETKYTLSNTTLNCQPRKMLMKPSNKASSIGVLTMSTSNKRIIPEHQPRQVLPYPATSIEWTKSHPRCSRESCRNEVSSSEDGRYGDLTGRHHNYYNYAVDINSFLQLQSASCICHNNIIHKTSNLIMQQ